MQKDKFILSEGDQWFIRKMKRNEEKINENDFILKSLRELQIAPKKVLEIGCSNGERLNAIKEIFGSECFGIDPSVLAIENGKKEFPNISLQVGTADLLSFDDCKFDLIIFGFCLYLCDRKDLFKIACEADRCLMDNGHLAILDFQPPFPYKNIYKHEENVFCYKFNYAKLFNWNPAYNEVFNIVYSHSDYQFSKRNIVDERIAVTVLNKNEEYAYPAGQH